MEEKEREVLAEIAALKKRLKALQRQEADLERIESLLYQCEISPSPRLWIVIDQIGQYLDESKSTEALIQNWMKELAFVYSASIIPHEAVIQDNKLADRKSGFCIEEDMAGKLLLDDGEGVEKICYEHR